MITTQASACPQSTSCPQSTHNQQPTLTAENSHETRNGAASPHSHPGSKPLHRRSCPDGTPKPVAPTPANLRAALSPTPEQGPGNAVTSGAVPCHRPAPPGPG